MKEKKIRESNISAHSKYTAPTSYGFSIKLVLKKKKKT